MTDPLINAFPTGLRVGPPGPPPRLSPSPLARVLAGHILRSYISQHRSGVTPPPHGPGPLGPRHYGPPEGPLGANAHLGWAGPAMSPVSAAVAASLLNPPTRPFPPEHFGSGLY